MFDSFSFSRYNLDYIDAVCEVFADGYYVGYVVHQVEHGNYALADMELWYEFAHRWIILGDHIFMDYPPHCPGYDFAQGQSEFYGIL